MAPLRIAFVHPDLGIGGAERLVVDAALGLQKLGHSVAIYTSHHDPTHCFEETRDGTLQVHAIHPPFPRSIHGKLHILMAQLSQLHLVSHMLSPSAPEYDVYFIDQLSTCVPFLRTFARKPVVFYCHFPDKLLANGAYVEGKMKGRGSLLKRIYRFPMDWLEETTTRQADVILANSHFTSRVFKTYFPSIRINPRVIYPGINIDAYEATVDGTAPEIRQISSSRPTIVSLNRFEGKKNVALAVSAYAQALPNLSNRPRLVLGGGYDPRVEENMLTLYSLIDITKTHNLTYNVVTPPGSQTNIPPLNVTEDEPDVLFLLNFTMNQRTALLNDPNTIAMLYTPANEHFGIGPVEGMIGGVPVLACNSGGPVESIIEKPEDDRTGWLREPQVNLWADALQQIASMTRSEREALSKRGKERARAVFSMDAMAKYMEESLQDAVAMDRPGFNMLWILVLLAPLVYFIVVFALGN